MEGSQTEPLLPGEEGEGGSTGGQRSDGEVAEDTDTDLEVAPPSHPLQPSPEKTNTILPPKIHPDPVKTHPDDEDTFEMVHFRDFCDSDTRKAEKTTADLAPKQNYKTESADDQLALTCDLHQQLNEAN